MPRLRAVAPAVLIAAALAGGGLARAQQATTTSGPAQAGQGGEPLPRPDPNALAGGATPLAGGDYGQNPPDQPPLAGGGYGGPPEARRNPGPIVPPSLLGNPLARPTGGPQIGRRSPPVPTDDEAYAALGVRAGAFVLRPSLETAGGYDDNPDALSDGGKGSGFYRLKGTLDADSDWSRHALGLRTNGQIRRFIDLKTPGYEPNAAAAVTGRIDVSEDTQLDTELRASLTSSRPGDPDTPDGIDGDEIEKSFGATLGGTRRFNRLAVTLEGTADRYLFNDSKLRSGDTIDNSDRVYNAYGARLRGAYELSPALAPFVEVAIDTRDYDKRRSAADTDDAGLPIPGTGRVLGSDGYAIRTGARLDMTRLITGELGIGYGRQTPKENSLKPVQGLLYDGALAWTVTGLTTVRLNARTSLQETTLAGSGGILDRSVELEIEHRLRRNLILTASAGFERFDYKGLGRIDDAVTLGLSGEYRLNRSLALIGSLSHERVDSTVSSEDYRSTLVEFGLRLRR